MMEREVPDEGVFSRRMSSNWAELPQTLRRRQKHRPDILSQFTDFSEASECESRRIEPKAMNVRRIVKRSELLRKFEINDSKIVRGGISYDDFDDDYNKRKFENNHNQDTNKISGKLFQIRPKTNFPSMMMMMKNEYRSLSDEERKTNSPDSLLVKSSDSESSSDDYGHTDDSGAFLESQLSRYENIKIGKKTKNNNESNLKKKLNLNDFSGIKSDGGKKSSLSETRLDFNKNIARKNTKDIQVTKNSDNLDRVEESRKYSSAISPTSTTPPIPPVPPTPITPSTTTTTIAYEYENIPRIDMSKINISKSTSKNQPTIEQLRMEIGCELRNNDKKKLSNKNSIENSSSQSIDELRFEGLIHDIYSDEHKNNNNNKMTTITEEKQDGSKLSVREILKRFEELRVQNEMQQQTDDKNNDKTLTTIQETLEKLDEKVKRSSNQVYIIYI